MRDAQAAVPLVPGTEDDCCARLQGRLELPERATAATWLDLLRGLGLATEGPAGFSRVRTESDNGALSSAFLETVYGAREIRAELAETDRPLTPELVADRTSDLVTPWERQRHGADGPAVWHERTADLLDWLDLLGFAERVDGGYRPTAAD